ncbi:MAG TPA: Hsp20/alpha crystallin family protein [Bacteroidota bacterium]|nr:Hsp20/alpha crystallin family protein [Bacteroidota bacterium]
MLYRIEPTVISEMLSLAEPTESTFPDLFAPLTLFSRGSSYPYINVAEYKDQVQVVAELPGVAKEDVKIQIHDGELTISGERKAPESSKDSEWLRQEIAYGTFSRTLQLPETIDAEKVEAEFANGVLRITLPKHEAAKPKEIAIR